MQYILGMDIHDNFSWFPTPDGSLLYCRKAVVLETFLDNSVRSVFEYKVIFILTIVSQYMRMVSLNRNNKSTVIFVKRIFEHSIFAS